LDFLEVEAAAMGNSKTKHELLLENDELKNRLSECEDTLEAIRTGAVDALVISDAQGEKIFSLQSTDYSYRVMVENMNEGTVTLNGDGIIIFANKAFSDLIGREMGTLVGARFSDFLSKDLHNDISSFIKKCVTRPSRGELSLAGAQSGVIPVSISCTNFNISGRRNVCLIIGDLRERNEAGQKLRVAYTEVEKKVVERNETIQELHLHQEELSAQNEALREAQALTEQSRSRFSDLYDYAPVGYFTIDHAGKIIEANLTACDLLGQERIFCIGKPLNVFIYPEDRDAFCRYLRSLGAEKVSRQTELRIEKKSKSAFFAQIASIPLAGKGTATQEYLVAISDISERKEAEQKLQMAYEEVEKKVLERTAELRESETRFRALADNITQLA
jgi:two-component system CheB/CheR fusion protein